MKNNEIWKDVVGYENYYQVSNLGNVRSVDRTINAMIKNNDKIIKKGKLLHKYRDNEKSYYYVKLSKKNKVVKNYIHRLVANAFIPNIHNKSQVNQVDTSGNSPMRRNKWNMCI